jgi:methionine-rich copper-binding protein CopC
MTLGLPAPAAHAVSSPCANAIACENQLPGTPPSVWDDGGDDQTILGYATQMSVNVGSSIAFKVNTDAHAYTVDIYRLGYYQGNGARKIATVPVTAPLPQTQPPCLRDTTTDLYDCGTWAVSATWQVPATAVSGVYIADLTRTDTGGQSQITFVVRNDASHSDVVFQTSDTTWQAYNTYGGASFYEGVDQSRAYKVSYNRPFVTRDGITMRDFVYANEYPTIRFLESNGIDVSYVSGVDIAMGQGHLTQHKTYLSVGHDEYWSQSQRDAVTQARDAGVNLAFLSGNEVYWRTRWEPSIDGSNTQFRTIVCYKDTWESQQIDPVSSTATWRDPRYAGFNPENSLSGTMYTGQGANLPLQVTAAEGKLRLWRNTSLTSLSPGTSATLAPDMVGYEADSIVDNGFQPAGQIAASTTVGSEPEMLTDFGSQTAPGTMTNNISEYRAASGALVFAAGSIQYGWGLDATHDLSTHAAVPAVQQATINLLADMGVQATTLQAGLVAASASSDHTAPVVTITTPAPGNIAFGTKVTVSGTASDAAGTVGGVEVSVDGGITWHPATGTTSWSYTGPLRAFGATAIQVRATDDSLNTSTPVSPTGVTISGANTVFGDWTPPTPDSGDGSATTLGMIFVPSSDGFVNGVRFYKSAANTGTHTGTLYSSTGTVLATGTFTNETATGWQTLTFDAGVAVTAGTKYVVGYYAPVGHYAYTAYFFAPGPLTSASLTAIGGLGVANGVYASGSSYPNSSYHQSNYFVDPLFTLSTQAPLAANAVSPLVGAGSVLTSATVVGRFNKDPGDTSMAISLVAPGGPVAGTSTYDPATFQLTFTPTQPLAYSTTFTATITDAGLSAPFSWSFTSVAAPRLPGQCPCTLLQDTDQPTTLATNDLANVTVGVAFAPTQNGTITSIRYWKPLGVAGPHPVTLYGPTGTALGTATASSETTVGWQSATFATAIAVTTGTTYTAAVQFPQGGYPYSYGTYGVAQTVGPLATPANAGRYVYGTGWPTNAVPTGYFVDLSFTSAASPAPTVVGGSPGNGAHFVPINGSVTVTFSEAIASGSGTLTLTGPSGAVAGSVTETATTRTFTPSAPLAEATAYVLNVTGAKTSDGVVQTQAYSETFTTSGVAACPCSLLETTLTPQLPNLANGSGLTLGLKFTPTVNGFITGLRYWRAASNTGTHTGKLYSATGTDLGDVTFADGAEGWQQATFSTPVAVTAGTPYFATYYSPNGTYSATTNAFVTQLMNPPLASVDSGGVYASGDAFPNQSFGAPNYFVDVVFTAGAPVDTAPSVVSVTPAAGATGVALTSPVTVTFTGQLNTSSVSVTLTGPGGTSVPGTLAVTSSSATFTPSAALSANSSYTVTVNASSPGGTAMAPFTSAFTTDTPVTVASTSPAANATGVAVATTVGVSFAGALSTSSVSVTLTPAGGAAVAGTLATTATSATFTPSAALAQSTVYTATVKASSVSGTAMAPYTWTFSTVSPAPVIASRTPVANATGVAANSTVQVTFTTAVDPTKSTLSLVNGSGVAVAGALVKTSTTVTFTPSAVLAANTTYTATVGASSPLGTAMTPSAWSFTTETAPTVSAITPTNGATGVTGTTTVKATFSKAVNPATIRIALADPSGTAVAGTLATTTTTGTFTPTAILTAGTVYRVTVNAALTDGLAATTFTSSFTTGAAVNIFAASLRPSSSTTSGAPLTVGVKFRASAAYSITGIRFYLPANVTSTYTVTLWSSTGTKLATASGSPTSATAGWRTVNLTTPVRTTANTTYVATVRALTAQYSSTPLAFLLGYTNGTFTVPASGAVTSSADVFPTATSMTNYFVDVVAAP